MEKTDEKDKYTVAEIPQWRGGWKRTFVFRSFTGRYVISRFDFKEQQYYRGIDFNGICLLDIIKHVRKHKKRALFFRQVEMP